MCVYIYIYIYIYVYIYIYIYICVFVCVCVYRYIPVLWCPAARAITAAVRTARLIAHAYTHTHTHTHTHTDRQTDRQTHTHIYIYIYIHYIPVLWCPAARATATAARTARLIAHAAVHNLDGDCARDVGARQRGAEQEAEGTGHVEGGAEACVGGGGEGWVKYQGGEPWLC